MNKKDLSETDIRTKFITPAVVDAGWDLHTQLREEVALTAGKVLVRGSKHKRGPAKFADYILSYKPSLPVAVIEAKDNKHALGDGMQQPLNYADMHGGLPFVFSSNGDGFLFHDRTAIDSPIETQLSLDEFPSPEDLWQRYCAWKGLDTQARKVVAQDYYFDGSGKAPRYYQLNAINTSIEAIAKGRRRILLLMATGTGKTYTAFQIIWRLWKSGTAKRILFLVDRNILADQAKTNDFKPFGSALTKIQKRQADKSYEVYLAIYQAVSGTEEDKNIYKQFSPEFFDLVVIRDVPVYVIGERVQYYGPDGKLITESHTDYTRRTLTKTYASLDAFLDTWTHAGKKKLIIEELEQQGVLWEVLAEEVGKDLDPFDLICHVAFGQPPRTRRERANNVRKRDYFTKYGDQARLVLDALLDKYADEGIENLEDKTVLEVPPFNEIGTPVEIVRMFGGKRGFEEAVQGLQQALYAEPPSTDQSAH